MRTAFEDSRHSGRMGLKEPAARKLVFKQQEELCLTGQRLNQYYAAKVSEYFAHEMLYFSQAGRDWSRDIEAAAIHLRRRAPVEA